MWEKKKSMMIRNHFPIARPSDVCVAFALADDGN